MKSIIYILTIFSLLLVSCEDKGNDNLMKEETIFNKKKEFRIIDGACGTVHYISRLGNNFDTALETLSKKHSDNFFKDYTIHKDTLNVDFEYDKRVFVAIIFKKTNGKHSMSKSDVLDSNGNYFRINWCKD